MKDRFDMEASIMEVWQTENDIKLVFERVCDAPEPMTEDELANVLLGIGELHRHRCEKLFGMFEEMIGNGLIRNVSDLEKEEFTFYDNDGNVTDNVSI